VATSVPAGATKNGRPTRERAVDPEQLAGIRAGGEAACRGPSHAPRCEARSDHEERQPMSSPCRTTTPSATVAGAAQVGPALHGGGGRPDSRL